MEIVTERLLLRPITLDDVNLLLSYYNENKTFLKDYIDIDSKQIDEVKYFTSRTKQDISHIKNKRLIKLLIFEKHNVDKLIGLIWFYKDALAETKHSIMMKYQLHADFINRGYMTEALNKTISLLFKNRKLKLIEVEIEMDNKAAIKVAEKVGFEGGVSFIRYITVRSRCLPHIYMRCYNRQIRETTDSIIVENDDTIVVDVDK